MYFNNLGSISAGILEHKTALLSFSQPHCPYMHDCCQLHKRFLKEFMLTPCPCSKTRGTLV